MRTRLGWLAVVLVASATLVAASGTQSGEVQFEAARKKAFVDGDLKGAIAEYEALIAAQSADRALVARALLLMAECHEKLGDAQSRALLDRIIRDYADQTEVAGRARTRLASRTGTGSVDRLTHRVAWSAPAEADVHGKISPDGRYLPFRNLVSGGDLYLRDLSAGVDRRMTIHDDKQGIEYAEGSAFSRDGQQLAFAWRIRSRDIYQLRIVSVAGAATARPRIVFDNDDVEWLAPYDWTPDGKWIAVLLQRKDRTTQIALVSAGDGTVRTLKSVAWDGVSNMALSPDGRELAFDLRGVNAGSRDVFVLAVDGSRETPAAAFQGDDSLVGWSPDGQLLFVSNRTGVQAVQPATAYRLRPSPTQSHIAYLVPDTAAERPLEVWVLENARPRASR